MMKTFQQFILFVLIATAVADAVPKTDYGVCGENNVDENGKQLECWCKLQADGEDGASSQHAEPWTVPFFGTNFCHKLSIDSPTCCNNF